jgi:hypothetical protein
VREASAKRGGDARPERGYDRPEEIPEMKTLARALRSASLSVAVLLPALPSGGCATVVGTAVSPFTGGIDLNRQFYKDPEKRGQWYWAPFVFVGGAVAGPFVALYNGVRHDLSIFRAWHPYWRDFGEVFAPFEMIDRRG